VNFALRRTYTFHPINTKIGQTYDVNWWLKDSYQVTVKSVLEVNSTSFTFFVIDFQTQCAETLCGFLSTDDFLLFISVSTSGSTVTLHANGSMRCRILHADQPPKDVAHFTLLGVNERTTESALCTSDH
jgi:hypothetical protein